MELIEQRTKQIMETCKERARAAGLSFQDETLEYIVTNRDLLDLSPKNMIPTLYDYWVNDIRVLQERKKYELYPHNPYETVINTRPAISFYNDNNPDWLNVMIFYHVLGHIDLFQNNAMFRHTWSDDFAGLALADKRLLASLQAERGRWVDYLVEFTRGIDNLVGFYDELSDLNGSSATGPTKKIDYYFDVFLSGRKKLATTKYLKEIERYNECKRQYADMSDSVFFSDVEKRYPEFESLYAREAKDIKPTRRLKRDVIKYICEYSGMLNRKGNDWMKSVIEIVRRTSLYFQPQIRTKILNEGWASYWHERLFLDDDRIKGHEVDFARVNARVMELPRAGLNPYALGWRLLMFIESEGDKGRHSYAFQRLLNIEDRKRFDTGAGNGRDFLFEVRQNYNDFMLINEFVNQDFVDRYRLFVLGRRLNPQRGVWEYYVKSRKAEDYKQMLVDSLYHPPCITVDESRQQNGELYMVHHFEGKPLVQEYIENTMMGIEYLWGAQVHLETHVIDEKHLQAEYNKDIDPDEIELKFTRIKYSMKDRKLTKRYL